MFISSFLKNLQQSIYISKFPQFFWDDFILCTVDISPSDLPNFLAHPVAKYSSEQVLTVLRDCWARDRSPNAH
jgi:hypothetical protein